MPASRFNEVVTLRALGGPLGAGREAVTYAQVIGELGWGPPGG
jgi:hypothetical protein